MELSFIVIAIFMVVMFIILSLPRQTDITPIVFPSTPLKSPKQILEDIKYQEKLEKEYKLVTKYKMMGKVIKKPTREQLSDPRLYIDRRWVKRK